MTGAPATFDPLTLGPSDSDRSSLATKLFGMRSCKKWRHLLEKTCLNLVWNEHLQGGRGVTLLEFTLTKKGGGGYTRSFRYLQGNKGLTL